MVHEIRVLSSSTLLVIPAQAGNQSHHVSGQGETRDGSFCRVSGYGFPPSRE
jgi:hypothetical protein